MTRLSGTISRKTLLNVLGTLSSILTTTQNWKYVCERVNFGKLALPERGIQEQARSFTEELARTIIAEAKGQYRVMFAIAAMAGLRAGEILALRVDDFDFQNRLLAVRRSVWRGKLQTPKTINSQAVLPLPDALAGIVKEHVEKLSTPWLFLTRRGHFFITARIEPLGSCSTVTSSTRERMRFNWAWTPSPLLTFLLSKSTSNPRRSASIT